MRSDHRFVGALLAARLSQRKRSSYRRRDNPHRSQRKRSSYRRRDNPRLSQRKRSSYRQRGESAPRRFMFNGVKRIILSH